MRNRLVRRLSAALDAPSSSITYLEGIGLVRAQAATSQAGSHTLLDQIRRQVGGRDGDLPVVRFFRVREMMANDTRVAHYPRILVNDKETTEI